MRYAAYGSNLHPRRLIARLPGAQLLGTADVPGWSLRFHKRGKDQSGKCDIVPSDNCIHVAVYEFDGQLLRKLDGIEGEGYERNRLIVPGFGDCQTYFAKTAYVDGALFPFDWYREYVLIGARRHGFPGAYLSAIERIAVCSDPDEARAARELACLEQLRNLPGG